MFFRFVLSFILSMSAAGSASAVILSKEVKTEGKTTIKCIIDTSKLSIIKTVGLIDEVGEIDDEQISEIKEWFANVDKEPSISEEKGKPLIASAAPNQEILVTIQDKSTVILRGKTDKDKSAFVRVGPKTTKLMEFIEKNCR